jgi:hypothetical protein
MEPSRVPWKEAGTIMTSERSLAGWIRKANTAWRDLGEAGERLLFYLSLMRIWSDLPLDAVIPAAEKDADVLPYAIDGIRRNLRHPLGNIFVVSPPFTGIQTLCRRKGCRFVDERSLVDMDPSRIDLVVNGVDRSQWIYQQFLKWSADALAESPHYLVVDADTVLVRPQVFERAGRIIFDYSDEYNSPYYEMFLRLLKEEVLCPMSFVSHHMVFEKRILVELRQRIEAIHGCDWKDAILRNLDRREPSSFSDYDTYGHYMFLHHRAPMVIEYWFNLSVTRKMLRSTSLLGMQYGGRYKSISFHSYRKE